MEPIRSFLPFSAAQRSRPKLDKWWEVSARAPFLTLFVTGAWVIFLQTVRANGWIYDSIRNHVGFIPALWTTDPTRAFVVANVGIIVQHSWGQIIYVSLLLLLVGVPYELRYGSLRAILLFYGACLVGVILLSLIVITTAITGPVNWSYSIATTSWSGASVGCFGLLGATIATAKKPWFLLVVWVLFEYFVEWGLVPGLAVTMHIAGFAFGFTTQRLLDHAARMPTTAPTPMAMASPAEDDA